MAKNNKIIIIGQNDHQAQLIKDALFTLVPRLKDTSIIFIRSDMDSLEGKGETHRTTPMQSKIRELVRQMKVDIPNDQDHKSKYYK